MAEPVRTYVVRKSGTISTKSTLTRKRFNRRLEENLRRALDGRETDYELTNEWDRLFVETGEPVGETLSRVFGVQGIRPSHGIRWETLEDIVREGRRRYADRVEGRTFGVFSRRVGQRSEFDCESPDIDRELGTVLDEAGGTVDLEDPEIEIRLEAHPRRAFFFDDELDGPGGLPVGTEGRAICLVSGGFDSMVAAWKMLKRGVALDFIFFNLAGYAQKSGVRQVLGEFDRRWIWGYEPEIDVVDFRPLLTEIRQKVSDQYWQVMLKRLMYEAAGDIADERGVSGFVTGEAVGQVSSQTLPNLAAIGSDLDVPVFRPLLGDNKEEIIERSRAIGIHDAAEQVPEFCGLAGGNPVTSTTVERVNHHRALLDDTLLERLVEDRRTREVGAFVDAGEVGEPIQIESLPADAQLLDLRSEEAYTSWHPSGAVHVPFETALDQFGLLPREPTWVLYCEVGLKSAHVADRMRRSGFDAYSYRGGAADLRQTLSTPAESASSEA